MAHFKILDIQTDDNGYLYVDYQFGCGPDGDVTNRRVGPFDGDDPYEDLRLWIAMNAEQHETCTPCADLPADIAKMVGRDTDTATLRQQFQPNLDAFNVRVAQIENEAWEARRQAEIEREIETNQDAEWG